jgi:DNA-binding CsgD family transcriptional regulator
MLDRQHSTRIDTAGWRPIDRRRAAPKQFRRGKRVVSMSQLRTKRALPAVPRRPFCPEARLSEGTFRERLLSPENPVEGLFTSEEWDAIGRALDLSQREMAVTILLIKGVSRQAIAHYLHKADGSCISADTVRVYIDRVFRKARVTDRLELALRLARVYLMLRLAANAADKNAEPESAKACCHTKV